MMNTATVLAMFALVLESISAQAQSVKKMEMKMQTKFVFMMANDIEAIRAFYGDVLGLKTEGTAQEGYVSVSAGLDLIFFKGDYELPVHKDWAWQPGYQGGSANLPSFSLSAEESSFRTVFDRIKRAGAPLLKPTPEWRRDSYWGITVRDPMGNTLEIYSVPAKKPDSLEWQ